MNFAPILDEIAKICGGTTPGAAPGYFTGAGLSAGSPAQQIRGAYSRLPEPASLAGDGLTLVAWWDGWTPEYGGPDAAGNLRQARHRIRMQLMYKVGRSNMPIALGILAPFAPVVIAALDAKLRLNGTCAWTKLEPSPGIVDAIYPDRFALELVLTAVEEETPTYAP